MQHILEKIQWYFEEILGRIKALVGLSLPEYFDAGKIFEDFEELAKNFEKLHTSEKVVIF